MSRRPPHASAVWVVGLLACAGPADPAVPAADADPAVVDTAAPSPDTGADTAAPPLPATADWMADVFAGHGDVALGQVLLPGAFNSSSYACAVEHGISPHAPGAVQALWEAFDPDPNADGLTRQRIVDWSRMQDRTFGEQLVDGIRAVEINVTVRDGALVTWHSVFGVPLAEPLGELVAFAQAHPAEAIVVTFGFDVEPGSLPLVVDALTAPSPAGPSFCDLVFDGPTPGAEATLQQVWDAGRPLVWGTDGDLRALLDAHGGCPTAPFAFDRRWSLTTRPDGVAATLAATVPGRDPSRFLQNDLVFSLDGSETVGEQAGYVLQHSSLAEALVTFGFAGDFPTRMIAQFDGDAEMNIFAGAYYGDSELVDAVVARNRARLAGE